mmetsp:Transcript_70591/g.163164  ORF Transcript_70591/g.163164 Transcript_70591/m.163164 type:complete len:210 (-) Transcript_70591:532-1161(-)
MSRAVWDVLPPGKTPNVSFGETVMRTGILFHLPCLMSSRGSPGNVLLSTTGCQPSMPGISFTFLPEENWSSPKRCENQLKENIFRESSSETQSPPHSHCALNLERQANTSSASLRWHPSLAIMKSVRSWLVVRDHISAGGECMAARWKSDMEPGATMWARIVPHPSLWPCTVTRDGSPPKFAMFFCTKRKASCWSIKPRLLVMLLPGFP